ncbi:LytR C-terminal domain-containing protein [Nocardioides dilutus]
MNLVPSMKSALTLVVLALLLVLGVSWGFAQVTKPFPGKVDAPICVDTSFPAGERIYPQDVTVSVLNASKREGLAGRTMAELVSDGFAEGQTRNAPDKTRVARVEIWTTDADNPAVLLVRSRLGQAEVLEKADPGAAGIVVVVGDEFEETFEGRPSIVTDVDIVVCGPAL